MGKTKGGCIDSIRKPNTLNILHPPSSLSPPSKSNQPSPSPLSIWCSLFLGIQHLRGFSKYFFFSLNIPGIISGAKKGIHFNPLCKGVYYLSAHRSSSVDPRTKNLKILKTIFVFVVQKIRKPYFKYLSLVVMYFCLSITIYHYSTVLPLN
jgi:hypothetical protein